MRGGYDSLVAMRHGLRAEGLANVPD